MFLIQLKDPMVIYRMIKVDIVRYGLFLSLRIHSLDIDIISTHMLPTSSHIYAANISLFYI